MGGFVIDTSPTPLWGTHTRFTLTPDGLAWLMEHVPGLVPDVPEESIRDRSKADSVAKALLVWQVCYFVVSCAARRAQSLPLSLFEVSTLAHALCTVLTYAVWWRKPLNIGEPTVIQGEAAREIAALMLMVSRRTAYYLGGLMTIPGVAECEYLVVERNVPPDDTSPLVAKGRQPVEFDPKKPVSTGQHTFTFRSEKHDSTWHSVLTYGRTEIPWFNKPRLEGGNALLAHTDILRWTHASHAMNNPNTGDLVKSFACDNNAVYIAPDTGLHSTAFMGSHAFALTIHATLTGMAITTLYGLPHLLGWNARFAHDVERRLWRISTIALTSLGAVYGLFGLAVLVVCSAPRESVVEFISFFAVMIISCCAPVVYTFASGYLLGESIRQLLILPAGSFHLPNLSIYLPNFS